MANQCNQSGGRLRFAAVLPWRRPDLAIEEMRRLKERGSVASIFVHGIEWDIPLAHPSFYAIYEEANAKICPLPYTRAMGVARRSPGCSKVCRGRGPGPFPSCTPSAKVS